MRRRLRVSEEVRHQLAQILRDDITGDARLSDAHVIVVEVKISPDLKNATAFILPLDAGNYDDDRRDALTAALNDNAGRFRHQLAGKAHLKFIPRLTFVWDSAYDTAGRIDTIAQRVRDSQK